MQNQYPYELQELSGPERDVAKSSVEVLKNIDFIGSDSVKLHVGEDSVDLPVAAVKLLLAALGQLAQGNALTLIPRHASLTTQEAADLLNVSRPFLVKLLEAGKIPFTRIGNRRKVLASDLFRYKSESDKRQSDAIDKLVEQAQEDQMGYE